MNNLFLKTVVAGIIATLVMTLMMMLSAQMGMPKMEPPKMLATTMGTSVALGWVMHFMIGIIFALMYTYLIRDWLRKISAVWAKGAVFGIIAFVIAQIGMFIMMQMFPAMPEMSGSMALMMIGSIVGHVVFGIVTALVVHWNSSKI